MNTGTGMTLRQVALVAGITSFAPLLLGGVPFAEFYVFAKLIVPGDTAETVRNIQANRGLFLTGVFAHLVTFVADVILAWALYLLLAPVNRALSLLTAWFRLIYAAVALVALMHLVTAFRLIDGGAYGEAFGVQLLHAQVEMLIKSFHYEWSLSIAIFGIHVALGGYLVARSVYIPRIVGILLVIAGLGYVCNYLGPYLYPELNLRFLPITFLGELVFPIWLLVRGWKIPEPGVHQ
jgi:Domain of unknown function (DUF4386)